jgi:hypothetical protein
MRHSSQEFTSDFINIRRLVAFNKPTEKLNTDFEHSSEESQGEFT